MKSYDDSEILSLFAAEKTKEKAFNILLKKYQKPVYFHIRRMVILHEDADDLTQDTFVKIWHNLHAFKKESKLFTWIYRIATNEAITFLNRKKRFYFLPFNNYESHLQNKLIDDSFFNADDVQLKLHKAILTLPQKQRIVFNMKYFDAMKYDTMAVILNTSVGALKASYHIAVKKIEQFLKNN